MTKKRGAGALEEDRRPLIRRLGVDVDEDLLDLALTHRSYAHEMGGLPTNERLEFLGDSVLSVVITLRLYQDYPDAPEAELSKMRAAVVSQKGLAIAARAINLGSFVLLGKGEVVDGGADKDSILSDTFEAIIGAVYLSHGLEACRVMLLRLLAPLLADAQRLGASLDWKTSLQERASEMGLPVPVYEVESTGPDHDRRFRATATVGTVVGHGVGTSKKIAEHAAAEQVYDLLQPDGN